MAYFKDADEVYQYLGEVFRVAERHPDVGPKLRSAGVKLEVVYTDPASTIVINFAEPMEVIDGGSAPDADVHLYMPADIADKYWRGEYNLAVGLAKGQVKAKGPVNKILKLVPLTKPIFSMYREMTADKDAAVAAA